MAVEAQAETGSTSDTHNVNLTNAGGAGRFVLVCEHATNFIPPELASLGLPAEVLESHIAWDAGALAVATSISEILDAPLVTPAVSRLVCDCNRVPMSEGSILKKSDAYEIPGNQGLSREDQQARSTCYYVPFHQAITSVIEREPAAGKSPVLVTIHSFVPIYEGVERHMDLGIIHDTDSRLADAMFAVATTRSKMKVEINAPYSPDDGVTHTLGVHALPRGLLNVMIEVRNDLISTERAQREMGEELAEFLGDALATIDQDHLASDREDGSFSQSRSASGRKETA